MQLSYTQITAPANGQLGETHLQKGQYVQPGQQLFSIISNEQYWIVANFKETQIEHMKIGQPVHVEVDGYPDQEIKGKIVDFSNATDAKFSLLPLFQWIYPRY
ncbi:HlyD family secretion protein [Arcticibacter eurypsychrophilus]|uniref:HlyD family secretion protein n=1 Tax=Arcticibacter eurypsychrophilus TaxID=1434752 RepID=UPI00084D174E|nr:HlyD family efflux transporter periplasmic adaptor subunit [Arcticibacter eurypsychrophilus]